MKNTEQMRCIEKTMTHISVPSWRASGATALADTSRSTSRSPAPRGADLERQREGQSIQGPRLGGPVGYHLAETKQPPPERHNSSGMVLPKDLR
jgi:hypothetical protein